MAHNKSTELEVNDKYYENLVVKKSQYYDETVRALDIVKRFIIREQRILVGGMAIDYALKAKQEPGIYTDDILPDYDFYSSEHHVDAYSIAEWLFRVGFRNVSVINALHPSTMRVRVNFVVVADITYIPRKILENIPTLRYHGFLIIHPHVQMIDQHRALSYPYENAPRETIIGARPRKDMKRYDMLYAQYPLRLLNIKDTILKTQIHSIPTELLKNQCATGFFALIYWIQEAKKLGYKTTLNFGEIKADFNSTKIDYSIPIDSHGISLYSDDLHGLYSTSKILLPNSELRFYNKFLDKLPRKVIIGNKWELLENDQKIAAHEEFPGIFIANLQTIMLYLLSNYILLMKLKNEKRGYSFYVGYLECRKLIQWASDKYYATSDPKLKRFFPTASFYGKKNLSESYIVSKHNFDIKSRTKSINEKNKYAQPHNVYDYDFYKNRSVPKPYFIFNHDSSEVFKFDGEICKPFL